MAQSNRNLPEEIGNLKSNAEKEGRPVLGSALPAFMSLTREWPKAVSSGWTQAFSVGVHAGIVALLTVPLLVGLPEPIKAINASGRNARISLAPSILRLRKGDHPAHGGGGGGDRELTPAGVGRAADFSSIQQAPPTEMFRSSKPILAVKPTILGPEDLQIANPNLNQIGDPSSKFTELSNGRGDASGIGNGHGSGIGDGDGPGLGAGFGGGTGGDGFQPGRNGVGYPTCSYMPNPPYSEEARQAKYSGVVLVDAVISADGQVILPRVVKSPGLGLNETTLQTMKTWRCKAALGPDRRTVPTRVTFEVNFRLF